MNDNFPIRVANDNSKVRFCYAPASIPDEPPFRFIDLFAGMGGLRIPFDELGGRCVFSSEWDRFAQQSYEANFGEKPHGDITKISPADIPAHDVLLAGFPCQAFSVAGERLGFEDLRGTLFFNVAAILEAKRPPAFLLENVKGLVNHDGGRTFAVIKNTLKGLGYHVHTKVLNALDHGHCQRRERSIIVGFRDVLPFAFPSPLGSPPHLNTILEPNPDPKLRATDYIIAKRQRQLAEQGKTAFAPSVWHENKTGLISVRPYSLALRTSASGNYLLVNGERRLPGRELLRLQGFPEHYEIVVSHAQLKRQTGNSVPVNMIRAVAQEMASAMRLAEPLRKAA